MIAFIDIEVSGWNKEKNALCEIAVVITDNNTIIHEWSALIKPYNRENGEPVSYKDDAMAVHGITMEELENGLPIEVAIGGVIDLFCNFEVTTIAGHGITSFDLPWLNYLTNRFCGMQLTAEVIDTLLMCRNYYKGSHTLSDACARFGITQGTHRALSDAKASFELWKCLRT